MSNEMSFVHRKRGVIVSIVMHASFSITSCGGKERVASMRVVNPSVCRRGQLSERTEKKWKTSAGASIRCESRKIMVRCAGACGRSKKRAAESHVRVMERSHREGNASSGRVGSNTVKSSRSPQPW